MDTNPLKEAGTDPALLDGWIDRAELARQLALSVDTLQRWETRRVGPPCVRVGRKVLYRKEAVRDWLKEQEARKTGQHKAVAGRRRDGGADDQTHPRGPVSDLCPDRRGPART